MRLFFAIVPFLFSCTEEEKIETVVQGEIQTEVEDLDLDGDGYLASEECDDSNSLISPSAPEICDGIDNNCDGQIDEGVLTIYFADVDQDDFGDPETQISSCEPPAGYVLNGNDCNDQDDEIFPAATERCNEIDDDCDGDIDEDISFGLFYDADGDGHGDPNRPSENCHDTEGFVLYGDDCDDTNAEIRPYQQEICNEIDDDCDGDIDEGANQYYYVDADNDGFGDPASPVQSCEMPVGYVENDLDCDDVNQDRHPNASEYCNGADDDCDGDIDEEAVDAPTWYYDLDGDGYASTFITSSECTAPSGYLPTAEDCDDTRYSVYPGAPEYCNEIDDDCDGDIDDNVVDALSWYPDGDNDNYGNPNDVIYSCTQPLGFILDGSDCDDANPAINPAAEDLCNEIDDDCDGAIDEGANRSYYLDADSDGFGDPESPVQSCERPVGYVENGLDCDDLNPDRHPNASEYCNEADDDCDGQTDEDALDAPIWYYDIDGDGYASTFITTSECTAPSGYFPAAEDCDDTRYSVYPNAPEYCNGLDDDCDEDIDEDAVDALSWYSDDDEDNYGDPSSEITSCTQPFDFILNGSDCDDADPAINPRAQEVCNEIDDDCDGDIDEGANRSYYLDADGDGFGDSESSVQSCELPEGYVENGLDCDDLNPDRHPNASEYCNEADDDCDGQTDEDAVDAPVWYYDIDGDGYASNFITTSECTAPSGYFPTAEDCDDTRYSVYPGAPEYCNGIDDDCSDEIDDNAVDALSWYSDYDGDNYGDPNSEIYRCTQPTYFILNGSDCNDGDPAINPAAEERCNEIDDNCDGDIDDNATDALPYYLDDDADGFGDPTQEVFSCEPIERYVLDDTDCDDTNMEIYPGAQELCDGIDQNCDGTNFYELDLDENGLLACQESIWIRNSSSNATSPNGACSEAASYLLAEGVTIHDLYHVDVPITPSVLENFGLYVHHGNNINGSLGAYTNAEATALEEWVYNGGRMLFIGYHSTQEACEASNSIPFQFGVSCALPYFSWDGIATSFVEHPLTEGLSMVGGLGGENWVVSSPPAQVLTSVSTWSGSTYAFLVVVEHGKGKVVLVADEWPFYNASRGGRSIGFGDNERMVQNIWNWLLE